MSVMLMSRAASARTVHWGVGLRFQGRRASWPVSYTALAKEEPSLASTLSKVDRFG